jgi:hypothetical protein
MRVYLDCCGFQRPFDDKFLKKAKAFGGLDTTVVSPIELVMGLDTGIQKQNRCLKLAVGQLTFYLKSGCCC